MLFAARFSSAELATLAHGCLAFDRVSNEQKRDIEKAFCLRIARSRQTKFLGYATVFSI